ncbi:MAG: coenzyme F420-0:L-glutamate ligase [Chloroflexi bacterium]|nr:coenzyme F420-0:L-glutamate ligase [Chloroflexota bacterium]
MLTLTPLPNIPLIEKNDDLAEIILKNSPKIQDGDIFVLAQKIISKAEGRLVNLADVKPSSRALQLATATEKDARLVELILQESAEIVRTRPGLIVVEHKLGFICANAGIDRSNINPYPHPNLPPKGEGINSPPRRGGDVRRTEGGHEYVLLLPKNPDKSAKKLRDALQKRTGKKLGILIIDSHGRAWREGIVGITIGLAGVPGVVDKRGDTDLFGQELKVTQIGVADELAAAASLMMGQTNEGKPIVHVRGFPYPLRESKLEELLRSKEKDLFR